jgi:hypothetical protein
MRKSQYGDVVFALTPRAQKVMDKLPDSEKESYYTPVYVDDEMQDNIVLGIQAWFLWTFMAGMACLGFTLGWIPFLVIAGIPPAVVGIVLCVIAGNKIRQKVLEAKYRRLKTNGQLVTVNCSFVSMWDDRCQAAEISSDEYSLKDFPEILERVLEAQRLISQTSKSCSSFSESIKRTDVIRQNVSQRMEENLTILAEKLELQARSDQEVQETIEKGNMEVLDLKIENFLQS